MRTAAFHVRNVRRRGSVYLAVLGVSVIVATLSVGGILASRVQARSGDDGRDVSDARFAALSGLEMGRAWAAANPNWRTTNATSGTIVIGGCTVSISATNLTDTNLSTLPLDPIYVTSTALKGSGVKQLLGQTVVAMGTPADFLGYAIHTAGQLHITAGDRLLTNQPVSANVEFRTEGILEGSAVSSKITFGGTGSVYGNAGTLTTARSLPATTNAETYAALGTLIPTGDLTGVAIGPGRNPYGTANAYGIYVMRAGSKKVTISNSRIVGTLVIITSKDVTISGSISMQPARPDFPSLIITGDTTFNYGTANLSETSWLTNFNPTGVPFNGVTNSTTLDSYASEIDGLVDIGGVLTLAGNGILRGAAVVSSSANDAVKVTANPFQVIYDPTLFSSPPNYYTATVNMVAKTGSITQIVK